MIKASYRSNSRPNKTITIDCPIDHLCIINGKEALSCLEIMELKGFFSYSGSFSVDGNDLLDATNTKRDRTPVSVITASSTSALVTRTSIPYGSAPRVEKINDSITRYINAKSVPTHWQSSFTTTVQSVYAELCAHPSYVVLDLARSDKRFALMVLDLLHKVLRTYRIYVYAPQVFPYPSDDIVIYDDIDSILNPASPKKVEAPRPQVNVREMAMAYFFDDLTGNHPTVQPEPVRPAPTPIRTEEPVRPVEPEPAPRAVRPAPAQSPAREERKLTREQAKPVERATENAQEEIPTEEEEENSFFKFDPNKTNIYNFVFSTIFFALAVIISFVFFSFKTTDEARINTFFWICLGMCVVFLIMSIIPIASLITDNKGPRFRDSKLLIVSLGLFPVLSLASAIVLLMMGKQNQGGTSATWTAAHYIPFAVAFIVYIVVLPAFAILYKKFKKKKK